MFCYIYNFSVANFLDYFCFCLNCIFHHSSNLYKETVLNILLLFPGEGRKRNQISVGSCSEVSLPGKITDSDVRSLNASIQAPSGLEEPCFLKKLPNGNIGNL